MSDFEAVYREFFPFICRYTYALCRNRALAEDLAQETFLKAMQHIGGFRGECGLEIWLCRIAKNTWYTYLKKNARSQSLDNFLYELSTCDEAPEGAMELHRALDSLEEPYREVVSLRALGGLPFAQIAQLHGKTESWARVTFHRGKLKLREMMEESILT